MTQKFCKTFAKILRRILSATLVAGLPVLPALAQQVVPCDDWRASAQGIVEPWEANSRAFAKGEIRLAAVDAIEPGAGSMHLLVLSPPYDELGARQCKLVTYTESLGYSGIDLAAAKASYDPAQGLTVVMPVQLYDDATAGFAPYVLSVSINQATGGISASLD
ncbi:conserved hypothetical protein [Rhodobacter ferrooxidans]|uniref:Uncharacterized protein n=1 Tax=Rhodobacter ferrooxidans TaxID=371731 RepID=C8S2I6_9RHOB|nr:conserved hypothetical protein [Rhodobacter sp. SW2]